MGKASLGVGKNNVHEFNAIYYLLKFVVEKDIVRSRYLVINLWLFNRHLDPQYRYP